MFARSCPHCGLPLRHHLPELVARADECVLATEVEDAVDARYRHVAHVPCAGSVAVARAHAIGVRTVWVCGVGAYVAPEVVTFLTTTADDRDGLEALWRVFRAHVEAVEGAYALGGKTAARVLLAVLSEGQR